MTPVIGNKIPREARPRLSIAGLTLVELMVAITIGLIILTAVARLFVTSRSTYTIEEGLARVQESGRFAVEFLSQDIRMAGYAGCSANLTGGQVGNLVDPPASPTTFNPDGVAGYKYTCTSSCTGALSEWSPSSPIPLSDYFLTGSIMPISGTDILVIQHADTTGTHLTGNSVPSNANIKIINTTALAGMIAVGDILMISDCKAADIIKVNSTSSGSGTKTITHIYNPTNNKLLHDYGNDAEIMKLVTRVYFIGRRDNSSSNPAALYRKELSGSLLVAQELVEGVEVMKLSYGEDTDTTKDGVPNIYRTSPSAVSNWRQVLTVRVGLLVRTSTTVDQENDTRTYDLAGITAAAGPYNDKYRRRAFNSTIQLRNHFQ